MAKQNPPKTITYFRLYLNREEVFASKRLLDVIRKVPHLLDHYLGDSLKTYSISLRKVVYFETGVVVENTLITNNIIDLM